MKRISIMASLMLGLLAFTSCDTDRDDNPVLLEPTSFTLLDQAFGDTPIDLASSTTITLKAKEQPAYGFPTEVNYGAQMALTEDFSDPEKVYTFDKSVKTLTLDLNTAEVDKGIMELADYTSASQVDTKNPTTIYVRLTSQLANDTEGKTLVYSNILPVKVYPYYLERKAADPVFWWMIGGSIGDGSWTNNKSYDAYKSVFPLSLIPEYVYDPSTGFGEIQSTIFIAAGGSVKLIHTLSDWNEQWGMTDGAFVKNDGGSGNISVSEDGFYTIRYNTLTDNVTMEKADAPANTFASVSIIGLGGDWDNDIDMTPAAGAGDNNHMWTAQITVTETTNFKFRANHDWGTNWGYGSADGEVNMNGFGQQNGKNIGIEPGKYTVYFNDIDTYFYVAPYGE